jgi:hypothetical protein
MLHSWMPFSVVTITDRSDGTELVHSNVQASGGWMVIWQDAWLLKKSDAADKVSDVMASSLAVRRVSTNTSRPPMGVKLGVSQSRRKMPSGIRTKNNGD